MYKSLAKVQTGIILLLFSLLTGACKPGNKEEVDSLNHTAYTFHYRNLDSTEYYARKALEMSGGYSDGKAEAYNNLAFTNICRMNYETASMQLDSVIKGTDNQIELLVADVQYMHLCQRKSQNKTFYQHFESALRRIHRIEEADFDLTQSQKLRLIYATTECNIVASTYFYYVGLDDLAIKEIGKIDEDGSIQKDTAQFLGYLYYMGSGGIIKSSTPELTLDKEMEYLMMCYSIATRYGYPYWQANSLQAISEHIIDDRYSTLLQRDYQIQLRYVNTDNMPDSLLAGNLAQKALKQFSDFGDVYQTVGAYRTLAQCYMQIGDYNSALICLEDALKNNKNIEQSPNQVAGVREQLCVAYSAVNDKQRSDYNRNIYLDIQEQTRQDKFLEARADQLNSSVSQLNIMIGAVVFIVIAVLVLLFTLDYLRRRKKGHEDFTALLAPLEHWKEEKEARNAELDEIYNETCRLVEVTRNKVADGLRKYVEQRAKLSIVLNVSPLIDRMLNELRLVNIEGCDETEKKERLDYVVELVGLINAYNEMLTQWIQLRRGELSLHIESFPLRSVFDMVRKNSATFSLQGINLNIESCEATVKADKVLTLFMVNTIADNARRYTPKGGTINIYGLEADNYIEVRIEDNGCGMSPEQAERLFNQTALLDGDTHGFGLLNCKGIIEKYKKVSRIFSMCTIGAESELGKGSKFFFRLPKGIVRTVMSLLLLLATFTAKTSAKTNYSDGSNIDLAYARCFSDSAYYANINGNYALCVSFADSCCKYLNQAYKRIQPTGHDFVTVNATKGQTSADIKWLHKNIDIDYSILLEIRNEVAVAALALHDWNLYHYNNDVYIQLYKEISADKSLGTYCRTMQRAEANKTVAVILLVLLLVLIFPSYYVVYYRKVLYAKLCVEKIKNINYILAKNTSDTDKLKEIRQIKTDRFPANLQEIVLQIKKELECSADTIRKRADEIDLRKDNLRKENYEVERLHVANNVLDNSLSTLKHETMYYPSKIKQLSTTEPQDTALLLDVTLYYKNLYSLLTRQAVRQLSKINIPYTSVMVSDILKGHNVTGNTDLRVIGNKAILCEMFSLLSQESDNKQLDVNVCKKNNMYVEFRFPMNGLNSLSPSPVDIFAPCKKNIPFFLCRQIVRDIGEITNKRACGIETQVDENGRIWVVLLLAASK